jgi:drug/metabolite transporter (DMT)-like permease
MRWLPIALVVISNVAYHVGQKAVPRAAHPLVATLGMYLVATLATLALLPFLGPASWRGAGVAAHWSVALVGVGIVGIEVGFLLAYRGGWPLSTTAVTATTLVALALLPIGLLVFRETLTPPRIAGLLLAVSGLWLLGRA